MAHVPMLPPLPPSEVKRLMREGLERDPNYTMRQLVEETSYPRGTMRPRTMLKVLYFGALAAVVVGVALSILLD